MEEEPLEDGEILLIIDASERYSRYAECFSAGTGSQTPRTQVLGSPDPPSRPKRKDTYRSHLQDHLGGR